MHKIIDNALPQKEFEEIKNFILNNDFSWNLTPLVTNTKEVLPITASYYFTHNFWSGFCIDPQVNRLANILNIIDCKSILRIKANLYPSTECVIHHDDHIDYDFPHKGAIFYLNTNNGCTVVENNQIESIENRLLIFDPTNKHHSTTCSDNKCRVNINFNFF